MATFPLRRHHSPGLAAATAVLLVLVMAMPEASSALPGSPLPAATRKSATTTRKKTVVTKKVSTAPAKAKFSPCGAGVECTTILVPLDPSKPTGTKIGLFVSRRPAARPTTRIGSLFVNPGGPGGPTFDLVRNASLFLTPEVLDRFDVVGVDPRGTERSSALSCDFDAIPEASIVVPADGSTIEASRAAAANLGLACEATDAKQLPFMDTTTAARDLDAVRAAIGESRISFLGMSYGTYLGAVYESLFPERTRSVILDSAIDPSRFGVNQILDPIVQNETSLDAFLTACADGSLKPCNFNDGTDLKAKYAAVRESYLSTARNRSRGQQQFDSTISSLIGYPRNGWPILGRALQEVATGVPANFDAQPGDNVVANSGEGAPPLDTFSEPTNAAILCRDAIVPRDPGAAQTLIDQIPLVAPRFSGLVFKAASAVTCTSWPVPAAPLTPLRAGVASTLVIGNTYDPTTPIAWSRSLANELGSALLVRNGGGHVAITKSACVQEAAARFLIDNAIPAAGTICSPDLANPT